MADALHASHIGHVACVAHAAHMHMPYMHRTHMPDIQDISLQPLTCIAQALTCMAHALHTATACLSLSIKSLNPSSGQRVLRGLQGLRECFGRECFGDCKDYCKDESASGTARTSLTVLYLQRLATEASSTEPLSLHKQDPQ